MSYTGGTWSVGPEEWDGANWIYPIGNGVDHVAEVVGSQNAHLIKAAPDLLEALEDQLKDLDCPEGHCYPCDKGRRAIAKARGLA